jgi:hypothetical protein
MAGKCMTDENKDGGSDKTKELKNKYAKMTMDEAFATIESQDQEINRLKELNVGLTEQLDETNKVLEGQEKGKLINEILPKSHYKIVDLTGRSIEDLKSIKATLDHAMPPRVNGVRFGVHGADLSDRELGLTVGDRSVVTAAKRKGAA